MSPSVPSYENFLGVMGYFLPALFFIFSFILVASFYWFYVSKANLNEYAIFVLWIYVIISIIMFFKLRLGAKQVRAFGEN